MGRVRVTMFPLEKQYILNITAICIFALVVCTQNTFSAPYYTVRSESRCALRLRYEDLVVSIEVAVEVCCCFTVFRC
jgi:hypothetical protein